MLVNLVYPHLNVSLPGRAKPSDICPLINIAVIHNKISIISSSIKRVLEE